jgi:hypothetical protein
MLQVCLEPLADEEHTRAPGKPCGRNHVTQRTRRQKNALGSGNRKNKEACALRDKVHTKHKTAVSRLYYNTRLKRQLTHMLV